MKFIWNFETQMDSDTLILLRLFSFSILKASQATRFNDQTSLQNARREVLYAEELSFAYKHKF